MESNTKGHITEEVTQDKSKAVDNRVITSKVKINEIDEKLDTEKKKIKNLSDMQDTVNSIAKSMERCIDLLAKSISGPRTHNKFNDMRNSNKVFLRKATASIEEESMHIRKKINELYKEKDAILKENREKYQKEKAAEEEQKVEPKEIEEVKEEKEIKKEEEQKEE